MEIVWCVSNTTSFEMYFVEASIPSFSTFPSSPFNVFCVDWYLLAHVFSSSFVVRIWHAPPKAHQVVNIWPQSYLTLGKWMEPHGRRWLLATKPEVSLPGLTWFPSSVSWVWCKCDQHVSCSFSYAFTDDWHGPLPCHDREWSAKITLCSLSCI